MPALQDIFAIWDPLSEMAVDLDLPYQTVAKWKQRGRIPSESWGDVIKAAKKRGHEMTFEQIAKANPPRQSAGAA
jgi:hypothetical protein